MRLFPLLAVSAIAPLLAGIRLDPVFGSGMVVQRDAPLGVAGFADPGESVVISFSGDIAKVTADKTGRWLASLKAFPASATGRDLVVSGRSDRVTLTDVLVGDVWVTAGQSNMEWPLGKDSESRTVKPDTALRVITFEKPGSDIGADGLTPDQARRLTPEGYYAGAWASAGSREAMKASAVGHWFAAKLRAEVGVPVGVVNYAIGGAPIEAFISREALRQGGFGKKLAGDWMKNPELPAWCRARAAQNLAKAPTAPGDALGKNHGYKPGFAWDAGLGRLSDFPITGFLWYQGESNAIEPARLEEYAKLQALMVRDWRASRKADRTPFYFVQLSSCEGRDRVHWGAFRDLQRRSLALIPPPAGMAVSHDCGPDPKAKSDVHPRRKKPVGERLALLALREVYGKPVEARGPEPTAAKKTAAGVVVTFAHAVGLTAPGDRVVGFEAAADGRPFAPVEAIVDGDSVLVKSPGARQVRYAWASYCMGANLVNGAGLPAPTFQIEAK